MFWACRSHAVLPLKACWTVDYPRCARTNPVPCRALDCNSWMRCGPDGWVDKKPPLAACTILPTGCSRRGHPALVSVSLIVGLAQREQLVPTLAATLPSSPRPSCEPSDNKVLVPWL
jgi:hypothetical protein